ncbi:MAG: hypothetical protein KF812_00270 [Fimbriimonadaceae bacterium]|nr:hypothetical protein [Fimbriimonadaceae bacterium]
MDAMRLLSVAIRAIGFMSCVDGIKVFVFSLISLPVSPYGAPTPLTEILRFHSYGLFQVLIGLTGIVFADFFARLCFGQVAWKRIDLWGDGELEADETP